MGRFHQIVEVQQDQFSSLRLVSPDGLTATYVPSAGMICCSLTHRGEEFLGQRNGLKAYATDGATMGIPFLHPWANRLRRMGYTAGGLSIDLPADSPIVHDDGQGLPIHGLLAGCSGWRVVRKEAGAEAAHLEGHLDLGAESGILELFPFPHRIELGITLSGASLTVITTVRATGDAPVPIAFGYHPYFRIPNIPRGEWEVTLPVLGRMRLDGRNLPTGEIETVSIPPGPLGERVYDDLFPILAPGPIFSLSGGGHTISVAFGKEYTVAVVYAPANDDVVCFEPMTAPTDPFEGGTPLRWARPGEAFTATFTVTVT